MNLKNILTLVLLILIYLCVLPLMSLFFYYHVVTINVENFRLQLQESSIPRTSSIYFELHQGIKVLYL